MSNSKDNDFDSCNNFWNQGSEFRFGFNNIKFSDRVLIIETLPDDVTQSSCAENGVESSCLEECSKVTKFHVNSLLLAAKSPYFYNLLSNGMMESEHKSVTLRIHASEETPFLELLNYMYSSTLTARDAPALFDVLKLADKFQVVSCMRFCASLLTSLPMTTESALLYLDLTSSLPMTDEVQRVAHTAKQFLTARFKDISKDEDEIMQMPLVVIEAILSSDALQVSSEDKLFDFALKWTETHYPEVEDQRQIFSGHLAQYIRFPHMSPEKLREVLSCYILDVDLAHEVVVDALFFKIKPSRRRHIQEEDSNSFVRRDYKWRPVKVLEFEFPRQELVVYFDLAYDECADPSTRKLSSESFDLGGRRCYLYAKRFDEWGRSRFRVCLGFDFEFDSESLPLSLSYEFAARSKRAPKFVLKRSGSDTFTAEDENDLILYSALWADIEAGNNLEFIDGVLYLELTFRLM